MHRLDDGILFMENVCTSFSQIADVGALPCAVWHPDYSPPHYLHTHVQN